MEGGCAGCWHPGQAGHSVLGSSPWAPTPGRMGPCLSAAADLCNIVSWEEEMIHRWMELYSLLQARGDCWRELGAAKAEFISAVLQ